ncbi:MAG: carboxypeptidase-like regulatory domain-containing protein [Candidatus Eremiobacteraeota bacterium]|nr:carboxypeptidase-like regulatory domain-containing protein [Candidatus Eremiobacteraeota bacterium]
MKNSKNFKVMATVVALLFLATSFIVMMGCGGGGGGGGGGSSSNLGTVTGTVYDSSSNTVTGALVSWKLSGVASAKETSTTTDNYGNFKLQDVTPGNVLITANYNDEAYHVDILVTADGTSQVLANLTPSGIVQGTISDYLTSSVLYGAVVSITTIDNVTLLDSSDTSGFYQITDVYTGTHTVYTTLSGYYTSSASVTVSMGNTTSQNFSLTPTTQPTPTPTPTVSPTPGTGKVYAVFVGISDYRITVWLTQKVCKQTLRVPLSGAAQASHF